MNKQQFIDLLKKSPFEYAYDKERKIYSVKVFLDKKPYIITMVLGKAYIEYSLADQKGNVLEVLHQEGNMLDVMDYKKK